MSQTNADEIDLGLIFSKIKNSFNVETLAMVDWVPNINRKGEIVLRLDMVLDFK